MEIGMCVRSTTEYYYLVVLPGTVNGEPAVAGRCSGRTYIKRRVLPAPPPSPRIRSRKATLVGFLPSADVTQSPGPFGLLYLVLVRIA